MSRRTYQYRCETCRSVVTLDYVGKLRYETEDKGSLVEPCGDDCEGVLRRVWKVNTLTHGTPGFYAHDTQGKAPDVSPRAFDD